MRALVRRQVGPLGSKPKIRKTIVRHKKAVLAKLVRPDELQVVPPATTWGSTPLPSHTQSVTRIPAQPGVSFVLLLSAELIFLL